MNLFSCANKTIISIRFKRFFIRLEKIGKSGIININKGVNQNGE